MSALTVVVFNDSLETMVAGSAAYVSAALNTTISPKVLPANSFDYASSSFFGAVVADIPSGQKGFVQVEGIIRIPLSLQDGTWVSGDIIGISSVEEGTAGRYTNSIPPNWGRVGEILNDPGGGDAFVFINRVVPQSTA